MPVVRIEMWEGRTEEQKRKLAELVTDAVCEAIGCPREAVEVIMVDVPKKNWAVGGKLASEKFPEK